LSFVTRSRRAARRLHRDMLFPLLDFVLPTDCFCCERRLGPVQRLGACPSCWSALRPHPGPCCPSCGLSVAAGTDLTGPAGGRCAACVLHPFELDGLCSAVAYDEPARRFLLRAKLGGRPELLVPLGEQLARTIERSGLARGCSSVVTVPSHPWSRLRRGFDPAIELGRVVARRLGLPLARRQLGRRVLGAPAKSLRGRDRRVRLAGAFRSRRGNPGRRVLLVDDVLTTGATAHACAAALRRSGAREVAVAVWARTPRHRV
jgi:predicted amidophosphoribosyltransferase